MLNHYEFPNNISDSQFPTKQLKEGASIHHQSFQFKEKNIITTLEVRGNSSQSIWWGEISYKNIDRMSLNPGVHGGCAMIVGNCSLNATQLCTQYGQEMEKIYSSAVLPDGSSGALKFDLVTI